MSFMQNMRDGYQINWKRVWFFMFRLVTAVIAVVLMIEAYGQYCARHFDQATFSAVVVVWCLYLWAYKLPRTNNTSVKST